MARVTVEDCILQVPNRFELVMFAAQRARDILVLTRACKGEREKVVGQRRHQKHEAI